MNARSKGQLELLALAGLALLALGFLTYFMFFNKPAAPAKLVIQLSAPKSQKVCVNKVAKVQMVFMNPQNNPPASVSVNVTAEDSVVGVEVDGAATQPPFSFTLIPGDVSAVTLYIPPRSPGTHEVYIHVTYLFPNAGPYHESYEIKLNAVTCG